jgi:hypothetical protein
MINTTKYFAQIRAFSYALVVVGLVLGIVGAVRSAAILVAIGAATFTANQFARSNKRRKIDFILPMAVALLLFVVALTLPHAK